MKYDFGFISIGDEISDGDITNTNSAEFAKILTNKDFNIGFHITCKDSFEDIATSLEFLQKNHKNIIAIGGLGPTEDDLTTQAIARYYNKELILDENSWQKLQKRVLKMYGRITFGTKKQAMFPETAIIIPNNYGSANGFKLEYAKNHFIYVFPGPPKECIGMLKELNLSNTQQQKKIVRKRWNIYNIGESFLAEKLQQIKTQYSFVTFKYRIDNGFIELKYFYPDDCPHSDNIIKKVEDLLDGHLQLNI